MKMAVFILNRECRLTPLLLHPSSLAARTPSALLLLQPYPPHAHIVLFGCC